MKQDKLYELTKKATEVPLEFTQTVIDRSKKLRNPSAKVDRIGSTIGMGIGVGLLFVGAIQIVMGKYLPSLGSVVVGTTTVASNYYRKRKYHKL